MGCGRCDLGITIDEICLLWEMVLSKNRIKMQESKTRSILELYFIQNAWKHSDNFSAHFISQLTFRLAHTRVANIFS